MILDQQENVEAQPTETVTLLPDIPEPEVEATWLKDNVPLSVSEEKIVTANQDCSFQMIIPEIKVEDVDEHGMQDAHESSIPLTITGESSGMYMNYAFCYTFGFITSRNFSIITSVTF